MTIQRKSAVLALLLVAPLSGCSSFLGLAFGHRAASLPVLAGNAPTPDVPIPANAGTEEGRQLLAAGQTGSAVEAFQRALAAGEPAGAASNGLAVAYARIGRADLAERYFVQALHAEPLNEDFAANMRRFMGSAEFAAWNAPSAPAIAKQFAVAVQQAEQIVPGRIERLSRGEVRIATVAPTRSVAGLGAALPVIRYAQATQKVLAPGEVIRVRIPDAKPLPAAAADGAGHSES